MKDNTLYKIKIIGGPEHDNIKGFFTQKELRKQIFFMRKRFGNDWSYDIIPAIKK